MREGYPVPFQALMVVEHDVGGWGGHASADHLMAVDRVHSHQGHFFVGEPSRLCEDLRRNPHLPDVVQQATEPQELQILGVAGLLEDALVDQIALELHAQKQC